MFKKKSKKYRIIIKMMFITITLKFATEGYLLHNNLKNCLQSKEFYSLENPFLTSLFNELLIIFLHSFNIHLLKNMLFFKYKKNR